MGRPFRIGIVGVFGAVERGASGGWGSGRARWSGRPPLFEVVGDSDEMELGADFLKTTREEPSEVAV